MAEDHLRKVIALYLRDWDAISPIFLLANRAFTHDTMGLTLASVMFGTELCLPCDLLSGALPTRSDYMTSKIISTNT
jgi:hypothetical protein